MRNIIYQKLHIAYLRSTKYFSFLVVSVIYIGCIIGFFLSPQTVTAAQNLSIEITDFEYNQESDEVTVTWQSEPGETYGLYWSEDLIRFESSIDPVIPAATESNTTTYGPFASPLPGASKLFFKVSSSDSSDPEVINTIGYNTSIMINFSEPLAFTNASDTSNYIVTSGESEPVALSMAKLNDDGTTVMLTTAEPLAKGAAYTVLFKNITDRAGRSIALGTSDGFYTWDNNPNGIKVFILAGQSNMQGHGWHDDRKDNGIDENGTIRKMIENDTDGSYDYLLKPNGEWETRNDVFVYTVDGKNRNNPGPRSGPLTVGYGVDNTKTGPEYGFGWQVGNAINEDVLLIKTCWGGKSLKLDFRPPSAVKKRGGEVGFYYEEIIRVAADVLSNIEEYVPGSNGKGYQIVGFGWHQGWNDRVDEEKVAEYENNLVDLINDIRSEFDLTNLPFVVANTGIGGLSETKEKAINLMEAQLNVGNAELYPDFDGNVISIDTRPFWREALDSPITNGRQGFHWNQNGETTFLIGDAMGADMINLLSEP